MYICLSYSFIHILSNKSNIRLKEMVMSSSLTTARTPYFFVRAQSILFDTVTKGRPNLGLN